MNYPIISFLMCVRVRTDLSKPNIRDIIKFFRDMQTKLYGDDREKVEFLIKFDTDDAYANKALSQIKDMSFRIRTFTFDRWEGMYTAHHNYSYMLARVSPNSKFIGFCGDDSVPEHISHGVIPFLERHVNYDYVFGTNKREMTIPNRLTHMIKYESDTTPQNTMSINGLIEPYPIISRKFIEICGFGYHYNIDTWLSLIVSILFNKYSVIVARQFPNQTFGRDNIQTKEFIRDENHLYNADRTIYAGYKTNWNQDMENQPTYIKLAEQAADNIYLNIKKDGRLSEYIFNSE